MMYDLVVIGATFSGLGAAYASRGNTLVVERRPQVGYEFMGAFRPDLAWTLHAAATAEGEKLRKELGRNEILSPEGTLYMPEVLPFLYHWVYRERLPLLLMAEVIRVEKTEEAFEIEVYTAEGIRCLKAKQVLDTTEGLSLKPEERPAILKKSINAFLWGGEGVEDLPLAEGMQFFPAHKKGEAVFQLELDREDGYIEARRKLHDCWVNRKEALAGWTLTLMADCLGLVLDRSCFEAAKGHTLLCSHCFENPLEAFEAGVKFAEGSKAYAEV